VHPQHIRPELLVSERIEAEDILASTPEPVSMIAVTAVLGLLGSAQPIGIRLSEARDRERYCEEINE
jgi:hypothetical protein